MSPRLEALCDFILARQFGGLDNPSRRLTSTHLCWIAFHADFEHYRKTGRSISGTTWCKGRELAFPEGLDERWAARFMRRRTPLPIVLAGDLIAGLALLKMLRS